MSRSLHARYAAVAIAAAIAGVVFLTPVGAHVSDSVDHLWGEHIKPRADQRYVRRYFAVVDENAALVRDKGATDATELTGSAYEVIFNRNVRNCAYVATLGEPSQLSEPPSGEIGVAGRKGEPKGVYVVTFDSSGAASDEDFHLVVTC
jgi:hypothetical protein